VKFRGILADSYPAAVLLVICALVPFLGLSSALNPLLPILGKDVHLSTQALALTFGMANAAYALGTVLSVQLAVHYPQRRLLVLYAGIFTFGSVLSATSFTPGLFIAGHILQGLMTSMMLIAAAPALVLGWPSKRLPITAMVMNLGIFGAVAAGPFIGGVQAQAGGWRLLFWIVCGVGALAFVLSLLTFEDTPPMDPEAPRDWTALLLAGFGCAAAFFGASELQTHQMLDLVVFGPLLFGVALLALLIFHQVNSRVTLMPMGQLLHTFPVAAVVIAVSAGAASLPLIDLAETALMHRTSPAHLGVLFLPELGGAFLTAFLFGALIRTRFVPVLAWTGLLFIAGGAAVLTGVAAGGDTSPLVIVGSGLVGIGLGSSVAPALFTTGFSLRSGQLPRVFAMLELLRGAAAFAAGPIILHLATTTGATQAAGIQIAVWVCFAIVVAGAMVSLYIFILGRARLQVPDIVRWEETGEPAWDSPPLLAGIRAPSPHVSNGNGLLDPSSREAARVEALARAMQLARGEG
jgi:MFS family permease